MQGHAKTPANGLAPNAGAKVLWIILI